MLPAVTTFLLLLCTLAEAWRAPSYSGYSKVWKEEWSGHKGRQPSSSTWNTIERVNNYNNELQTYTRYRDNIRYSGEGTLHIIPNRKSKAARGWTSGRIESKHTVYPRSGRLTRVEAKLRLPNIGKGRRQGIWPAFWLLGESVRSSGTKWPKAGEIDIMENINGERYAVGSAHCDKAPGGICNEPTGLGSSVYGLDGNFHTWRVEFERRKKHWRDETITWYIDGKKFHSISGNRINSYDAWVKLCHQPMFIIFNVAVGGDWPGYPNSRTAGGQSSMMEIGYVAEYTRR